MDVWKSPRFGNAPLSLAGEANQWSSEIRRRVPYYDDVLAYGRGPNSIVPLTIGSHANQPITMTYAMAHATVRRILEANLSAARAQLDTWKATRFVIDDLDFVYNDERIEDALDRTPAQTRANLMEQGPGWQEMLFAMRRYWQTYIQAVVDDLAALDTPPEPPPPPA